MQIIKHKILGATNRNVRQHTERGISFAENPNCTRA